ncbi:hypothetical protein [Sphingopyxis sp. 113P3]|uniref:hypothetical protein n=1 Tax=Sphingopyxis sp. (strain 113P3) TaxID=292913 RepID=UPI0006AD447E|nr:hypothetical protein [Sphingopyxis sp. 113P3]ALC12523.1 hypothetical protein LH20_11225 [Sphingopyxis sp. 113P3]
MIVKIQRPIVSNADEPMALVYNRDRSLEAHMLMTPGIEALFADGSLKVYHRASLRGTELHIGRRVKEPNW